MIRIRNQVYGSKDPDQYQNITDPEHCQSGLYRHSLLPVSDDSEQPQSRAKHLLGASVSVEIIFLYGPLKAYLMALKRHNFKILIRFHSKRTNIKYPPQRLLTRSRQKRFSRMLGPRGFDKNFESLGERDEFVNFLWVFFSLIQAKNAKFVCL